MYEEDLETWVWLAIICLIMVNAYILTKRDKPDE